MEISIGYYVSYVQIWQARGPSSVRKTTPTASGGAKSEGPEPSWTGSSDPMREAGAPNTRKVLMR
jgi:hypothetical protein